MPPSRRAAKAAIFGVFFGEAAVLGQWIPRIPDIKDKLALTDTGLGIVLLMLPLGTLLGLSLASRIIASVGGLRTACRIFLPLWAMLFILPGLAADVLWLGTGLFLTGACIAIVETAMNTAAARLETLLDKRLMSRCHGFWSLGTMVGTLAGGAIAQAGLSVSSHYLIAMPVIALGGFVAASALPRDVDAPADYQSSLDTTNESTNQSTNDRTALPEDVATPQVATDPPARRALFSLPHRGMLLLCIMPLGIMMVEGAFIDWSAVFMRDILAADPWLISITYAFFSVVMAAVRLTGDSLAARVGDVVVVRISGAMATLGIVLFALAPNSVIAFAGATLSGAGVAIVFPLAISAAARRPERTPTENVASLNIIAFSAFLIAPPLIGILSDLIGLRLALLSIAPLAFLTFLLAGEVKRPGSSR